MHSRPILVGLAAAVTALTALVYLVLAPDQRPPVAPHSSGIGFNVSSTLPGESPAAMDADLAAMRDAGAGWVRLDVDWSAVERTRGRQDWSFIDRAVDAARAHDLQVLGVLAYTPRWAQDASVPPATSHGRPSSAGVFATFAGQAAAHFAGRIRTWEIWNEPNNAGFFLPRVDAPFYAAMVRASYPAIHRAVPEAVVLAGALSPATGEAAPASFLRQMYAAGAGDGMDAVSAHPYSYPALPSGQESYNAFYQLRDVRAVMAEHGDAAKQIWLTEFGAPTGPGKGAVSEQRQAAIMADGLAAARSLSYVGPVFVYELRDADTGSSDIEDNFGVLRTDRSRKPAYAVVMQQAVEDAAKPVR